MDTPSTPADVLLEPENEQELEGTIMLFALTDRDFMRSAGGIICKGAGPMQEQDFRHPDFNKLFPLLRTYWEVYGNSEKRPTVMAAFPGLANVLVANNAWHDEHVEQGKKLLAWLMLRPRGNLAMYAGAIKRMTKEWLYRTRAQKLVDRAQMKLINPDELSDRIADLKRELQLLEDVKSLFAFGEAMEASIPGVERIITPYRDLNAMIRGWGKRESSLFIVPRGGGKTLTGLQSMGVAALAGYKVLFITNEQGPEELEPRVFSAFCDIPFEKISDDCKYGLEKTCTAAERERAYALRDRLKKTAAIMEWKRGASIKSDLNMYIDTFRQQFGGIDFLVYDWIGRGLGDQDVSDSAVIRHMYRQATWAISDAAKEHNIATLTFAQANVVQSHNKPYVDDTMVTEHKQIAEPFTHGFGISAMRSSDAENAAYATTQNMFAFKARKSQGKAIKIDRDFGYQRFKDFEKGKGRQR